MGRQSSPAARMDGMKIVILDGYTESHDDVSWEPFEVLGNVTIYDRTAPEDITERIGDAEAVIVNKVPITRDTIEKCGNLRYIGVLATGYNIIDVRAAGEHGIVVTNIPSYGTTAVAQYVFALLLEICHHVGAHSRAVYEGAWEHSRDWCFWNYPLIELAGKTMGIIGFGRIGRATSKIARALGMKVLAYDEKQYPGLEDDAMRYVPLDELLRDSDVISLHCPLFDSTRKIINADSIAKMKDGVIIINTSRGPLIDEAALADALNRGKVYAAAVDVVSTEPIQGDNPLLKAKNCFITPHIAWAPKESRERLMNIAAENMRAFIEGKPINTVC